MRICFKFYFIFCYVAKCGFDCAKSQIDPASRELLIHGKAMVPCVQFSTNCGLGNFINVQILFSLYQELVDNCNYGTIAFPCKKEFPAASKYSYVLTTGCL